MSKLMLHRGGWSATLADLASVPVPEPSESYVPVPYPRLVEEIKLHVPRFGLEVVKEETAWRGREGRCSGLCRAGTAARIRITAWRLGLNRVLPGVACSDEVIPDQDFRRHAGKNSLN